MSVFLYLLLYVLVACLFAAAIIYSYTAAFEKSESSVLIFLVIIWPITIILILLTSVWENYYKNQTQKIFFILRKNGYNSLNDAIPNLPVKDLELLLKAEKIGVINLSTKQKQLVQRYLVDKCFEKSILGGADGKRKDKKEKDK